MTITFPRPLPDVEFVVADFVQRDSYASSTAGRIVNVTQIRDPAWQVSLATRSIRRSKLNEVESWWLSLRGGLRSCRFIHPHLKWPQLHYQDNTPAENAGNLVSVTDGNILAVDSVDASLSLSIGDRIGIEKDDYRSIGRVVEVSGAGTSRTIEIEPTPPATTAVAGSVVRFASPELIMRPVSSSWRVSGIGNGPFQVSFSLIESAI